LGWGWPGLSGPISQPMRRQ